MIPNDEQLQISDAARQFAQERLKPFAAEWDREHRFPKEAIGEMAELGFFGMLVPEEWGGCDTGYLAYAMALEEIAAGDGACSTIMSVHNSVGCVPILKYGNDDQKERFLKPLASGSMLGAFALTEPQAGSDASGLKTRARLEGDHYVLNGCKQFITSGQNAGVVIVFAVTDPSAGKRGITADRADRFAGLQSRTGRRQTRPARLRHLPDPVRRREGAGGQPLGRGGRRLSNRPGQPRRRPCRHRFAIGGHGPRCVRSSPRLCPRA
jgi:Acyl-CoA dehydrogenases